MNRRVPERHALAVSQPSDVVGRQRMGHDPLLWSGSESGLTTRRWACVAARILVDPADGDDVAAVNKLQDQLAIDAKSAKPLAMTAYDTVTESL